MADLNIFYVVKFKVSGESEVVPDLWYSNEYSDCYWPASKPREKAKNRSMFRLNWIKYEAVIMSVHSKFSSLSIIKCNV